ncbi:MAG: hypothetical protein AABX37_05260 [Nanoarchaeota archaeon]
MEIVSLLWFIVIIALIILIAKIIVHSIKFIFVLLVVAFVMVFWFGVSYTDIVDVGLKVLLWAL